MINLEENSCFEFLSFARKFGNFSSNLFLVKIGATLSDAKNQGKREGNSSDANERTQGVLRCVNWSLYFVSLLVWPIFATLYTLFKLDKNNGDYAEDLFKKLKPARSSCIFFLLSSFLFCFFFFFFFFLFARKRPNESSQGVCKK